MQLRRFLNFLNKIYQNLLHFLIIAIDQDQIFQSLSPSVGCLQKKGGQWGLLRFFRPFLLIPKDI